MGGTFGGGAAAANAAQYAAAAQAYADAAQGAAAGISELKAQVAALTAEATAAASALAKVASAPPATSPVGSPARTPRGPAAPRKTPDERASEKRAKDEARQAEYVYQIKQRYLRQQEKDEAKATAKSLSDAKQLWKPQKPQGGTVGERAVAGASPWAKPPPELLPAAQRTNAALREQQVGAKGAASAIGDIAKGGDDKAPKSVVAGNKSLKLLAKNAGISRAILLAPIAAGGLELTKLALGYKGMAQLDALVTRAGFNIRRLFKGVDPSPAVRGVDRFLQVVNPASVTGKALEGIFNRTFNGLFGGFEKLQPVATAAFQGIVLGALYLEESVLDIEIGVLQAGLAFKTEFPAATEAILSVLAPLGDLNADLRATAEAIKLIYKIATGGTLGGVLAVVDIVKKRSGSGSAVDDARVEAEKRKDAAAAGGGGNEGAPAAAGASTASSYIAGLIGGLIGGAPGAAAAARFMAGKIDPAVREATETHSPSAVARRTGREYPAGYAEGIEQGTPDVQAAADNMAPAAGSGAARGAQGGGSAGVIHIENHWPEGVGSARRGEIEAAAEAGIYRALRAANAQNAIPRSI